MLITLNKDGATSLQSQLLRAIVDAIHDGQLSGGQKMLPSRQLASDLGIARNTVTAVYEELVSRGYLVALPRKGYFVQDHMALELRKHVSGPPPQTVDWTQRLTRRPSELNPIIKPSNWQDYKYPFVCGQVDPALFPFNTWRACSRDSLGRQSIDWWVADRADEDDPALIEQIRRQILPRRGIYAREDEILITLGSQEGFFLLGRLLADSETQVGVECPGYPDSRNIFELEGAALTELAVDADGACLPSNKLDMAILTPAHHCPSMVTMGATRRKAWLDRAKQDNMLLIEDDYEGETSFVAGNRALKSQDTTGSVIYLGTLSKTLAPGMRLGFLVADAALIRELRWMRRLMHRSAPLNNQRLAAIFLAEGHYAALVRQLRGSLERRFATAAEFCDTQMNGFKRIPATGGASIWLELPPTINATELRHSAMRQSVLTEDGDAFVHPVDHGRFLRLGVTCIPENAITSGLGLLAQAATNL